MSSRVQTRSLKARPKRNIKRPQKLLSDSESFHTSKRKALDENRHNRKVKKNASLKNQSNSTQNKRGPKKKEKPSLSNETTANENQLCKATYVILAPLKKNVLDQKLKTVRKETKTKAVDIEVNHRRSSRQRNKIMEVESAKASNTSITRLPGDVNGEKEVKTKTANVKANNKRSIRVRQREKSPENKNENIKATSVLRSRTGNKILLQKRHDENAVSNKIIDSSGVSKQQPAKENTTSKQELFKKPVVNGLRKMTGSKTTPIPSKLRKREYVNYAESSLGSSADCQKNLHNVEKIPIYKQPVVEEKTKKRPINDLYEFDESDGENVKKKKKKKDANSSSEEYNRTIRNILKNVVNKVRKRNNKKDIYSDAKNNNAVILKQIQSEKNKPQEKTDIVERKLDNMKEKTEENTIQQSRILELPQENFSELPDNADCDDSCFGFETDRNVAPKANTSKINIISDIQLQPCKELNLSIVSPASFRESRPKAHSTMLNNVFSPWRFNEINIKRNPHFLSIKESSLPCITQEMILDHSIVDKFEDLSRSHASKTPQRKTGVSPKKKTPVQKYLTDYFGDKNETENKENHNISLFDDNQFSPIKNHSLSNRVNSVKRKILCEQNDNNVHASTPQRDPIQTRNQSNSKKSDDDHTNYGFSTDEEEIEEIPKKTKDAKPFRVSVNVNDKKYTRQKVKKNVDFSQSDEGSEEQSDLSDTETRETECKLFDDFDDTEDYLKDSKPVFKKRTKLKWMTDDNEKPRKRKDVRTKEEEEEAEKWAAAFNSMCEEVEQFPLEIE